MQEIPKQTLHLGADAHEVGGLLLRWYDAHHDTEGSRRFLDLLDGMLKADLCHPPEERGFANEFSEEDSAMKGLVVPPAGSAPRPAATRFLATPRLRLSPLELSVEAYWILNSERAALEACSCIPKLWSAKALNGANVLFFRRG